MAILDEWKAVAYDNKQDRHHLEKFWNNYFEKEKGVYAILLKNPDKVYKGTVHDLAEQFGLTDLEMAGFLDGIQESLKEPNPIETMEADTEVSLCYDLEKLYRNMVDARAEWLYTLPEWDNIYSKDKQHDILISQRKSHTVNVKKIGRNDPCPCGSGKKYKFCHGRKGAEPLPGYEQ